MNGGQTDNVNEIDIVLPKGSYALSVQQTILHPKQLENICSLMSLDMATMPVAAGTDQRFDALNSHEIFSGSSRSDSALFAS